MPKDIEHITDPAVRRKLDAAKDQAKAAKAFDQFEAELADAFEARKQVPTLLARVDSLEKALARPVNFSATLKTPAKPKGDQKRPDVAECLITATAAELMRRVNQTAHAETIKQHHPGDDQAFQRRVVTGMLKAATNPATTTAAGWAAELVMSDAESYWSKLSAISVAGSLVERGLTRPIQFGDAHSLVVPQRAHDNDGAMRPAWIAEGASIPHVSGRLASSMLLPFKLAAISSFSDELAKTSVPNIRSVIESFIFDDSAVAIDEKLLSADIGIAGTSPSGLYNGKTPLSAGVHPLEDLKNLISKMVSWRARRPVFIMGDLTLTTLKMWVEDGTFLFRDELAKGTLFGIPVVHSATVAPNQIAILDCAALYLGLPVPLVDISATASIVMASASGTAPKMGNPDHHVSEPDSIHESDARFTTPPAEVRSMFQTAGQAVRVIHNGLSWTLVHPDAVEYMNVTWN
ncbi:phage major capsid protein [Falsiphaeobacter marinintestinus]|uniref:phage major capsid protein n=1 Tax=Falsiphaeobacter marinintestinus TaxID=1492905 RepID=UPI001646D6ED|nr:phage major capsid protein [Phaeobacter marinintestinus]